MPPIPKKALRTAMQKKLGTMSPEDREKKSAVIQRKFLNHASYKNSLTILAYASFGTEVETDEILHACLRDGKNLVLTRIDAVDKSMSLHAVKDLSRDLGLNQYGIREPRHEAPRVALENVELILVPGLAFSETGERLGRGHGYYDRLLERAKSQPRTIALAYDFQIFAPGYFETAAHDWKVKTILTELRALSV